MMDEMVRYEFQTLEGAVAVPASCVRDVDQLLLTHGPFARPGTNGAATGQLGAVLTLYQMNQIHDQLALDYTMVLVAAQQAQDERQHHQLQTMQACLAQLQAQHRLPLPD